MAAPAFHDSMGTSTMLVDGPRERHVMTKDGPRTTSVSSQTTDDLVEVARSLEAWASASMQTEELTRITSPIEQRQCTICFGDDTECPGLEWCRPCRCRGTSRWVHRACILRWIDEKQKRKGLDWPVKCEQCQYLYRIRLPPPSLLERIKSVVDEMIHFFAPFGAFALCTGSLLYISFKLGVISSRVVAGPDVTDQWLVGPYNYVPTIACTMTPMALLGFGAIKWEYFVMRGLLWAWARSCHAARIISQRIAGTKDDAANRLAALVDSDPSLNPPTGIVAGGGEPLAPETDYSRLIVTSLALPFASAFCGRLLFSDKPWSMLQKSICGGVVYLLTSGAVSVVCKLQSEGRRKSRWIEDYDG